MNAHERLACLPPAACADARTLILGSMPGAQSLAAQQYYAHPRNQFWSLMGELAGAGPQLPYPERLQALNRAGIALWDVLRSCVRPGSLDSAIRDEEANDFSAFFATHPHIVRVCFNGGMAARSFRRHVLHRQVLPSLQYHDLPSTSPAHAARSFSEKLSIWRTALDLAFSTEL